MADLIKINLKKMSLHIIKMCIFKSQYFKCALSEDKITASSDMKESTCHVYTLNPR